jgi:hypothetical protein
VLDQIAVHAPDQARRFVFLTGGVFSDDLRNRLEATGVPQLDKPVAPDTLRAELLRIADAPASPSVYGQRIGTPLLSVQTNTGRHAALQASAQDALVK